MRMGTCISVAVREYADACSHAYAYSYIYIYIVYQVANPTV